MGNWTEGANGECLGDEIEAKRYGEEFYKP
jgi:hypothetical protein